MNYSEAEQWVIGSILINPENIDRVRRVLSAGDFINPDHSRIFAMMEEIEDSEGVPLDISTVCSFLQESEKGDDAVRIAKYLKEDIPTDATLDYWMKVLKKGSLERRLRDETSLEDIDLSKAEAIIHDLGNLGNDTPLYTPIYKIPPLLEDPATRIKTGFVDLDKNLRFGVGNVMVISGKTGEGKTSLGLNILFNIAKEKPVGVVSIEMTDEEVRQRVENSFGVLPENFFVAAPPALSTLELKHICKAMDTESGVEVFLIDYLQLMREREDFRSRHLEVSHIIRRIKEIAKELRAGFIVISSLGRGIDHREEGSLPSLSDLKESGDIEYAADSILFIHQPKKGDEDYRGENVKSFLLEKNRFGKRFKIKVFWNDTKTKFGNFQEGGNDGAKF